MAKIRLLLDEDVRPILAEILRHRGYDVIHVLELERSGKTDAEQLDHAVNQRRAILTTTSEILSSSTANTEKAAKNTLASYFPSKSQ